MEANREQDTTKRLSPIIEKSQPIHMDVFDLAHFIANKQVGIYLEPHAHNILSAISQLANFTKHALLGPDTLLENLEVILAVAVTLDSKGLLLRYKHTNKHGVIVAMNTTPPDYLANKDIFVQGNAYSLLPVLYQKLAQITPRH
jgi:hypothetical protein